MSNIVISQINKLGESLGMAGDGAELMQVLKNTAFKGSVTDAQMAALLVVANSYRLNPWTKEIYAFPDQNNGIVPVVGVDGWARIINEHKEFDGMEFHQDDEACTCTIYRKDRSHPIKVTEYMAECKRDVKPWKTHPKRMLRHKAMIQCARLAFGFVGIYEQDEAERIAEIKDITPQADQPKAPVLPDYTDEQLLQNRATWQQAIESGKATAQALIDKISTKFTLSQAQKDAIYNLEPIDQ